MNVSVNGILRSFNTKKGYGFLTSKVGDIFLHVSVLREELHAELVEGARLAVLCEEVYKDGEYKKRATGVLRILPPKGLAEVFTNVKWFDREKGYGFVLGVDAVPDAFLHISVCRNAEKVSDSKVEIASITPGMGMPILALIEEISGNFRVKSFKFGPDIEAMYSAKLAELHADDVADGDSSIARASEEPQPDASTNEEAQV